MALPKEKYESRYMVFDMKASGSANAKSMIAAMEDEIQAKQSKASWGVKDFILFAFSLANIEAGVFTGIVGYASGSKSQFLESCEDFWRDLNREFDRGLKSATVEFKAKGIYDTRAHVYVWSALVPTVSKRVK